MGQFEAAATNFANATRSPDLALQSKAYYNRGNALVTGAESREKQGDLDTALRSMDEAITMYENAMTLSPADEDAKVNYELALKKKQELQKKQQQQQKQDQNKKDQSQKQEDQKKDQQQKQDQQKDQPQDQKQDQPQNKEKSEPQQQTADQQKQPQPQKSEEMTPEEAKMMLDAMKQEEQASRDRMRLVIGQPTPVDKDW
jgi:outer membrane biosynthesis protein TonB